MLRAGRAGSNLRFQEWFQSNTKELIHQRNYNTCRYQESEGLGYYDLWVVLKLASDF